MRRPVTVLAAACLAAGTMTWVSVPLTATEESSNLQADQTKKSLQFPAGFQTKDLGASDAIKGALASVVDDAVNHNHFDNLIGNFVDQDRDRMSEAKNMDVTKLNEKIGDIRRTWKEKYGQDFDITDEKAVFGEQFAILQGEVGDPQLAAANWPVAATPELSERPAAEQGRGTGTPSDMNLDKGRNVALVRVPDSHKLPGVKLSLIHELPASWRLDIPNNISGQQIYDNLLTQLTWIDNHKDQWPTDVNDAYRLVSHHVFMALYNVNLPMHERG